MQKNYVFKLLVLLLGMTFSNLAVNTAFAATTDGVYTPTVEENEITVFLETNCSNAKVWAWTASIAQLTDEGWPGAPMTLMGKSANGKNIFKWTCTKDVTPTKIIFTHDGEQKFLPDNLDYVNHGYYVEGVYSKTIETTPEGKVMIYFDNTAAKLSDVYCYIYSGTTAAAEWPGKQMAYDANATFNGKTGYYTLEVPKGFYTGYFVVNGGTAGSTLTGETVYVQEKIATAIDETTISEVRKATEDGWFTISGMRVSKPSQPGLYIYNGKKVIIRK